MKRMHQWATSHIHSQHANKIFGALIFIESFFLVPVSTILSFYCIEKPKQVFLFASIASIASLFGSAVGYYIGSVLHTAWDSFGERLISWFMTRADFKAHIELYRAYEGWQITAATLTPIPFKLITISAGFCHLHFPTFIFYSALGRAFKFFTIATAFHFFGERVLLYVNRYLYSVVTVLVILSLICFVYYYYYTL